MKPKTLYIYKKNQLVAIQEVDDWSQAQLETLIEILRSQGKTIKIEREVNHEHAASNKRIKAEWQHRE